MNTAQRLPYTSRSLASEIKLQVHQAVIMNWCPVLKETGMSVTMDPVYLFPDDPVDVIQAFVGFLYEGFFVLTESVTVENVLDFMSRIGLNLPQGSYRVIYYTIYQSNLNLHPIQLLRSHIATHQTQLTLRARCQSKETI